MYLNFWFVKTSDYLMWKPLLVLSSGKAKMMDLSLAIDARNTNVFWTILTESAILRNLDVPCAVATM